MSAREQQKPKAWNLSPRLADGTRIYIQLGDEDLAKTKPRQLGPWGVVTDLNTGKRYALRGASCGLTHCHCDAVATELQNKGNSGRSYGSK